jgi:hypothetical protein
MTTERDYEGFLERLSAFQNTIAGRVGGDFVTNPALAEELNRRLDALVEAFTTTQDARPAPPDQGLAALIGIGPDAAATLGDTRIPIAVAAYDETVTAERVNAVADLYYIYQHERIGVFRVVQKLQDLFKAGTVRLSAGPGAYALYRFDRREVLRYTRRDRLAAYRRALGYGTAPVPTGSRANTDFHRLFTQFNSQVALFWRDKRISDVVRERAFDPSFGSIAVVRRAGLDLRNNLKFTSFGHLNVLRVEVMQLLEEAFRILNAPDIRQLFGADNAWDVVEEVLVRYFRERLVTSPRQRMAVTGREILRWLSRPNVLQTARPQFEALLLDIAEPAEEWITSAKSLGVARRSTERVLPWATRSPVGPAAVGNGSRAAAPVP